MSTILRAQQKQKGILHEQDTPSPTKISTSKLLISLVIGCLIVISIMAALLINKQESQKAVLTHEASIEKTEKIDSPVPGISEPLKQPENKITKVVFNTKAIPAPAKKKVSAPKAVKRAEVRVINQKVTVTETPIRLSETKPVSKKQANKNELKMGDLDQKLKDRFALAIAETDNEMEHESNAQVMNNDGLQSADGENIHDMAIGFQQSVPPLSYDTHVYSSKQEDRWIRINGHKLYEGDKEPITNIEVVVIKPYETIFRLGGQSFSLEALVDWKG